LMDWVDGRTLREELKQAVAQNNVDLLHHLSIKFDELALWLLEQPFAHTDLKTENILVTPDLQLVLVDYDGLFVPEMQGQEAREEGTSGYKHPRRNAKHFDRHTDDFSLLLISISLRLIAEDPEMYTDTKSDEHLLFTEKDLTDFAKSELHETILNKIEEDNGDIGVLFSILKMALDNDDGPLWLLPASIKSTLEIGDDAQVPGYSFQLIKRVKGTEYPDLLYVSLDGNYVVGECGKGLINVYRIPDFEFLYEVNNCDASSWGFVFSPDGQYMTYGGCSHGIKVHRVTDDTLDLTLDDHEWVIGCAGFTPNGNYLVSGDLFGRTLNIYCCNPLRPMISLTQISDGIFGVTFSQDGELLATRNSKGIIKVIDYSDLKLKHKFIEENEVNSIAFSADGAYLASGGYDGTVNLYEISSGSIIHTFKDQSGRVNIAFSPDGNLLVVGSELDTVNIYDTADYSILKQLTGFTGDISSINFTANGKYLTIHDYKINIYQVYYDKEFAVPGPAVMPATWFNTPERRLDWWNSLKYEWQSAFCETVFYKSDSFTPNDDQLVAIFNMRELYVKGTKAKEYADLSFLLTDLTGIQHLTNLEKLICFGNNIVDLTPLQHLKHLKNLICSFNNIMSVEPLGKLTRLETLVCNNNRIYDLEPLSKLRNLQWLNCSYNKIKDFGPLDGILNNFYRLSCKENPISLLIEEKYTISKNKPSDQRNDYSLVKAGKSIGDICLGVAVSSAVEKLGLNYSLWDIMPGGLTYKYPSHSLEVTWNYPEKTIYHIRVSHPAKAKTAAGIQLLKNTLREAAALYGEPVFEVSETSNLYEAWFGNIGFGVEKDLTDPATAVGKEKLLDKLIVSMAVRM
jgi:WD40 repeat protein